MRARRHAPAGAARDEPFDERDDRMTVLTFTDEAGVPWQVWAVHPPSPDRRSGEDRRAGEAPDPWHERRRADRRVRDVGRPAAIAGALARGWLCFESQIGDGAATRRRLAPIPDGWADRTEAALRALLGEAVPARRSASGAAAARLPDPSAG